MYPRTRPAAPRRYEIFEPKTDLVAEQGAVTLLVYLPDFKKEQLRAQLSSSRVLRMSGERPLGDDRWKRFVKEIRVPEECDTKGIVAKFDGAILYVKQPKFAGPAAHEPPSINNNMPEKQLEEEEPRKDIVERIGSEEEDHERKCADDAERCDLVTKNEQEIRPDEGGRLEKIKINWRKLLLILVLVVALLLRVLLYKGRVL